MTPFRAASPGCCTPLDQPRTARGRLWAAAAIGLAASLFGDVAGAQTAGYAFRRIADTTQVANIAGARCVAIANDGSVIFTTADHVIWRGDGTAVDRLAEPGTAGQPLLTACPGLNDGGEIVYAVAGSGTTTVVKRSGQATTVLASSGASPSLDEPGGLAIHSLTNAGATFVAGADGMLYVMPGGTPAFSVQPQDPAVFSLVPGTMNENGVVAFQAVRQVSGMSLSGVYRGTGTPLVEQGGPVAAQIAAATPVVNNAGVVAFLGQAADGTTHLWSTVDGTTFTDHSGPVGSGDVRGFSINDAGIVAFDLVVAGTSSGVFTGPGAAQDKVIAPGDALDGSVVVSASVSLDAINNAGQVAFWVELSDGRSGVYRADPVQQPAASDGTLETSLNAAAGGTLAASDPQNLPLTFEIVANGTRGSAVIDDPAAGTFTYTPNPNAIGSDSFTFRASNGTAASNVATVTVTIVPGPAGNSAPVAHPSVSGTPAAVRVDDIRDELFRTTNLPPVAGFTMMGWVRFIGDSNANSAFMRLGDAVNSNGYNLLRCCGNDSNGLYLWNGAGIRHGAYLTRGTWYHIALSVEGTGAGQAKVYLDGQLVLAGNGNPNVTQQRLSLGNDAHKEWLDGSLSTVKIYDVALTREEIAAEMGQFTPVRTANLNAWYPLLTAESAATDFSGNDRTLTVTGALTTDTSGPPLGANATPEDAAFNGTLRADDPEFNPLTFAIVANPSKGTVVITDPAAGTYTYTPDPTAPGPGTDTFTFKANDGMLDSNAATIDLTITRTTFPLTVTVDGAGAGTVVSAPGAISCSTGCSATFQRQTAVTLTATPSAGSTFRGWAGACTGTGSCVVTMDAAATVNATFAISSRDLLVTSVSSPPALAAAGSSFSVAVTTTNQGTIAAGQTTTRFYFSPDPVKDAGDLLLGKTLSVGSLASDASSTTTLTFTVPLTLPAGPYHLLACADDLNVIVESSESNNCYATAPIDVQRADLVETALTSPPAAAAPGATFSLTDTAENRGRVDAAASTTRYYLSADSALTAGDILLAAWRAVPILPPGATSTGTKSVTVPATTPLGTYFVLACADDVKKVTELDESNNCVSSAGTMLVALPDLVESGVSTPATSAIPGKTFAVTETVENRGNAPAAASTTRFYLSTDGLKANAVPIVTTRSVGILAAGALSARSTTVTVPASTPLGAYHVVACADDLAKVIESAEDNNCLSTTTKVTIGWPDLLVTSVSSPPAEIAPGKTFLLTDTVLNDGQVTAVASTVRSYLSTDGIRDAADIAIATTRSVPILDPAISSTGARSVTVPAATPPGQYVVISCADDLAKVAEDDETNNCLASPTAMQVRLPDLVTSAVSNPPAAVAAGASVTITDTVQNLGAIAVSGTATRYYLSSNGSKVGAVLLGTRSVASIVVGGSNTGSRAVTIPLTTAAGAYYTVACADDTAAAIESDETNNCLASATVLTVQ